MKMVTIEVIFLLLSAGVVPLCKATITDKPFENTKHNNLFFDEDILFERTARSTSDCAHHCGQRSSCVSFTFAKNWTSSAERSGTCRGNSALRVSGSTSSGDGAKTFVMADMCMNAPCQNGGTCVNRVDQPYGYLCLCTPGYTDLQCQTDIDECSSFPCQNGGTCVDQVNGYLCQCEPGYGGVLCQTDIDDCSSSPCQNGGTCADQVNSYLCQCMAGYNGFHCQTDINECASSPCQHGGTCVDQVNGYLCQCAPGAAGLQCQIDVDECASSPCDNNSTCVDQVNGYLCQCLPGNGGVHCQTDIDECASSPCQNGGTCVDQVNGYLCQCEDGYTGVQCQTDIDECASSPCRNNATCVDQVNSYLCQCVLGYDQKRCQRDINECASSPCQHGGSCVDGVNSYTCTCEDGFSGVHCESVDWLGSSCTDDSQCPSAFTTPTVCYLGQCLCRLEHYYSAASGGCVATCATADLKWTYLEYANLDIHVPRVIDDMDEDTLASCQNACNTNALCHAISFSLNPASYNPCYRAISLFAASYYPYAGWTVYKKTCA